MDRALPLPRTPMVGRFVTNEMLVPKEHGPQLWAAFGGTELNGHVRYMNWPTISSEAQFVAHLNQMVKAEGERTLFERLTGQPARSDVYAIVVDGVALGIRAFLSIDLKHRTVEAGRVVKAKSLAGTTASIETTYLAMVRAFDDCGFRRWHLETAVDNIAARRKMEKSGYAFEGIARSAKQIHGKDCDMARYSMTASEWPTAKLAFETALYHRG